mgnify:CR=1 FL=1
MKLFIFLVLGFFVTSIRADEKNLNLTLKRMYEFANRQAHEEVLEEAKKIESEETELSKLKFESPERGELYLKYHFYKLSAYAGMLDKENAVKEIELLNLYLDTFSEDRIREFKLTRYYHLTKYLEEYVATWKERDLAEAERLMRLSAQRLDNVQPGEKTQKIQKKIVDILDSMINQEEQKKSDQASKGKEGDSKEDKKGAEKGAEEKGQEAESQANKPKKPQDQSQLGKENGKGEVDHAKLKKIAGEWGKMPPAERAKVVQEITRDLPAKYRPMIEEYFKALNRLPENSR